MISGPLLSAAQNTQLSSTAKLMSAASEVQEKPLSSGVGCMSVGPMRAMPDW